MARSRALVSGFAGLAMGVAGTLAVSAPPSKPPTPEPEDVGARDSGVPRGPTLAPAPLSPPPPPPDPAARLEVDLADWLANAAPLLQRKNESVLATLWQSVAVVYARLSRPDDVERVCAAGLAAGANGGDCTWPLSQLPEAQRTKVFAALRARHPDLVWDPMLVVRAAAETGDRGAAFEAALGMFRDPKRSVEGLQEMVRLDPARAAREVGDWRGRPSAWLTTIAQAFAKAGEKGLATEWAGYASRRATEEQARVSAQAAEQRRALRDRAGRDPSDAGSWAELGQVLESDGDREGAAEAYRRAVEIDSFREDEWQALARLDPAGAIPLLKSAAARVARDVLWIELAKACLRLGRGSEAMEAFEHVHSDALEDWWQQGFARAAPDRALAWLAERMRSPRFAEEWRYVLAHAEALLAVGRKTAAWEAYDRLAEGDTSAAWAGWVRTDPARALELAQTRLREEPQDSDARRARADSLRLLGRREEAAQAYEAIAADGDDDALYALAAMGSQSRLTKIEEHFKQAGDDAWAALRLAEVYRALGREADARKMLARADAMMEDDVSLWIRRWFPQ